MEGRFSSFQVVKKRRNLARDPESAFQVGAGGSRCVPTLKSWGACRGFFGSVRGLGVEAISYKETAKTL